MGGEGMSQNILVVGPHPDDLEFGVDLGPSGALALRAYRRRLCRHLVHGGIFQVARIPEMEGGDLRRRIDDDRGARQGSRV